MDIQLWFHGIIHCMTKVSHCCMFTRNLHACTYKRDKSSTHACTSKMTNKLTMARQSLSRLQDLINYSIIIFFIDNEVFIRFFCEGLFIY